MIYDPSEYCDYCGSHPVQSYSTGPKSAQIVVVTNRRASGKFLVSLEQQLTELGLNVGEIYFTPVIKCTDFETQLTTKQLRDHAARYLLPELEAIQPKYILALGNESLQVIDGRKSGITKYRGKFFEARGATVMSTLSPAAVNRNPGMKNGYMADLRLFANKVRGRAYGGGR